MHPTPAPTVPPPVSHEPSDGHWPYTRHLEELRRRLWTCIGAVIVGTGICASQTDRLMAWLMQPAGELLPTLAVLSPAEGVLAYLKVAVFGGVLLAMPVVFYQAWRFIQPALHRHEQRMGAGYVAWASLLFGAGCAFAYWVLLPLALQFLLGVGGARLTPVIAVGKYLTFTTGVVLGAGLVFELPVAVYVLAKAGIATPAFLRQQWRYAVLLIVVVSAVITPTPDVVNLLLMVAPLLVLYEISIWVAALATRKR